MLTRKILFKLFVVFALFSLAVPAAVLGDGTETLGPPLGVTLASGTGIVAAGVGLADGSGNGTISFTVPPDATVKQVFIYWEGQTCAYGSLDYKFRVNGLNVIAADPLDYSDGGDRIGEPIQFFFNGYCPNSLDQNIYAIAYRLDITDLNLVTAGPNVLTITELNNFGYVNDGVGVFVIYEESAKAAAAISVVDGIDLAFINFPEPKMNNVPQTFTIAPADVDRTARLSMFFSSIKGAISGFVTRPNSIDITVGGVTTTYSNLLYSANGEEWDTLNLDVTIPAGVSSLTVQAFSRDDFLTGDLPASLFWIAAGLSVPSPPICGNGLVDTDEQCDDGNLINDDGCTSACTLEVCGDGIKQSNEQCDDGNLINDDGCTSACMLEVCGDGIKQSNEECDDGNTVNGDGCTSACMLEVCGDGIKQSNEQCDDGNTVNGDGCSSTCTTECVPCKEGVQSMTLQLNWRTSSGDPNERIRVRADSLTGQVLYDSWSDGSSNPGLPVGANFSFNVPLAVRQVFVTVQGKYHRCETLKATFSAECNLAIGQITGNTYIKFKVVDARFDGNKSCSSLCAGSIGDFVWYDNNKNGIQEAGEPGVPYVTVTLSNGKTTKTNLSGRYSFEGLCAGTYTVKVKAPFWLRQSQSNAPGSTSSNDSNGSPASVTLTTNASINQTIDFGFYMCGW